MIYISGPMKGLPNDNREAFWKAEEKIKEISNQLIFNPASLPDGWTREQYLRKDIEGLCQCSIMVLLPGFENSDGCKLEIEIARNIGITMYTYENFINERLLSFFVPR